MFRFIHISDLHFSKISFCLSQFFSKRWVGNLNLIFSRKKKFHPRPLFSLIDLFSKNKADFLVVTGDLTSTSSKEEYQMAKELFTSIEKLGIKCYFLPGNHDHYTKSSYRKRKFYNLFSNLQEHSGLKISKYSLRNNCVEAHLTKDGYWLVLLDTAKATSWISSKGYFTKEIENNLLALLSLIPKDDKVILANHFPFSQQESIRKILDGGKRLQEIISQNDQIKFYLHGHTHRHCVADLQPNSLPIVLDSGSSSHNQIGSFNYVNVRDSQIEIDIFRWIQNSWKKDKKHRIELTR